MRAARLQELEEMMTKLQATARALPSGPDRHNILQEIGKFRDFVLMDGSTTALAAAGSPTRI
jgi:hypothetical protein